MSTVQFPAYQQAWNPGSQGVQDAPEEPRYTSNEVARITALTLRQLQWWDEQHILKPSQEAHKRWYTREEVFTLLLYRELRARGFSLARVREVKRLLRQQDISLMGASRWLATNGERVLILNDAPTVLALLEQRRYPMFHLISLDTLAKRLDAAPALPAKREPARARSARPGGYTLRRMA